MNNAVINTKSKLSFPDSFEKMNHPVIEGANQWLLKENNEIVISIVGGGKGLYGNGITTFEMWDYREDEPRGYLTKDDINNHLNNLQ